MTTARAGHHVTELPWRPMVDILLRYRWARTIRITEAWWSPIRLLWTSEHMADLRALDWMDLP